MKHIFKNLFLAFLIFLCLSAIFSLFNTPKKTNSWISLGQLVEQINQEKVEKIIIRGDHLEVRLKNGEIKNAQKEPELALTESLKNYGLSSEKLRKIEIEVKEEGNFLFWLGAVLPFLLPSLFVLLLFWFMFKGAQKGQMQAFSFIRSKARLITPTNQKERVTFKDVAGLKEAKEELKEIIDFLKNPQKFINIGARIPKGVLLMGPPGTGKTLLARAVAGEAKVPFFNISGSEFIELFVGVGASRVRDLFRVAKKSAPCIVFIDEIDAIGRQRGFGFGGGHEEREQTLNQILVEMDGFEPNTNVIVMAATNRPDVLDPALLRPGRFDRRIILDEPDIKDREEILKIHTRNKKLAKNVDLREIAERTPGFSGADLANLVNEAALLAARRDKKEIEQTEFRDSIEKVLLGPERKSRILSKKEKEIAAYHEAGHALVNVVLPHTDPVHKISIISRGKAAGYTLKLPVEDKHFRTKSEFLDELAVLLGGYTAEEIVFKDITTGAANDLNYASHLARKLVTQYGMSKKIGPVVFGERGRLLWGQDVIAEKRYSEKIAAEIDEEVLRLIKEAHREARRIILQKRDLLDKIAQRLIKKETIERKEFERLVKQGLGDKIAKKKK